MGIERSVIDYVVVCNRMKDFIEKLVIDEDQNYVLSNYSVKKERRKIMFVHLYNGCPTKGIAMKGIAQMVSATKGTGNKEYHLSKLIQVTIILKFLFTKPIFYLCFVIFNIFGASVPFSM